MTWTSEFVPEEDRTTVRETADTERLPGAREDEELWLRQLLDRMPDHLELDATTVADLRRAEAGPRAGPRRRRRPSRSSRTRRTFFRLLYNLLVDADRGPRLPTLFLALGADKVRSLLSSSAEQHVVRGRAGVAQELRAALPLGGLADRAGGEGEQRRGR